VIKHNATTPNWKIINGCTIAEYYYNKYGDFHSLFNQPSIILYLDGKLLQKQWHKKGFLHREKKHPAVIYYSNKNEKVIGRQYYKNGELLKIIP
jgi:antitoxin component YwqK of YwqJK toxin-antitoxin module